MDKVAEELVALRQKNVILEKEIKQAKIRIKHLEEKISELKDWIEHLEALYQD